MLSCNTRLHCMSRWPTNGSRHRRAVVSALQAVGETGMSLLALSLALDLPEQDLRRTLDRLIATGRVGSVRRGTRASADLTAVRYRLARRPSYLSALPSPGVPATVPPPAGQDGTPCPENEPITQVIDTPGIFPVPAHATLR